jgi:cyanophycinase-like exopeptidase
MATTFSKIAPSGSSYGKGIKITGTSAGASVTFHTAINSGSSYDEIWLYVFNSDTASHVVTVDFGGQTVPDNNIVLTVQPKAGLVCVVPGLILGGAASLVVDAFADAANVVTMTGFVNRITVA